MGSDGTANLADPVRYARRMSVYKRHRFPPDIISYFSQGRIPAQQHSIIKGATEEFVGIALFVPGFEGERKGSTRPAMRVLTAGTARACIHDLRLNEHFRNDQLLSTPR